MKSFRLWKCYNLLLQMHKSEKLYLVPSQLSFLSMGAKEQKSYHLYIYFSFDFANKLSSQSTSWASKLINSFGDLTESLQQDPEGNY